MFGKRRKSKSGNDDFTQVDSAEDLAQAFIDGLHGPGAHPDDRTEVGSRTYTMKVHHPAWATFWSLFIWGAGFIYTRRFVTGIFAFLFLFVFHLLFLSLSGVLPERVAQAFLSDIGWQLPQVESLWILTLLVTILWSLNLIVPTWLALRELPGMFSPRTHWYTEAFSFVPILGFYLNGRFRWGHFSAIAFYFSIISFLALNQMWNWSATLEPNELKGLEVCFNTLFFGFSVSVLVVIGLLFHALADFLSGLGLLEDSERAATDWKFVALGVFIALFFLSFRLTGQSGSRFRMQIQEHALECEERNLHLCGKSLDRSNQFFEGFDARLKEFYDLL